MKKDVPVSFISLRIPYRCNLSCAKNCLSQTISRGVNVIRPRGLYFINQMKLVRTFFLHKPKNKIFKFQGQLDLEGQGQGHQFSKPSEIFR